MAVNCKARFLQILITILLAAILFAQAATAEQTGEISLTFSFGSDSTLGDDYKVNNTGFQSMVNEMGYAYFFENLYHIFSVDDMTVVNLEGPLTEAKHMRPDRKFNFRCAPENVQILLEGSVETVNLANNHTYDFQEVGYTDTLTTLENAGIASYGYDRIYRTEIKGVRISLIGLTEHDHKPAYVKTAVAAERESCDILIVTFHWGWENNYRYSKAQRDLAQAAVDGGADLIIGHHTHVLGGIGNIDGVNVVYSLGNLCFGGNPLPSDMSTYVYTHTFTLDSDKKIAGQTYNVIPLILNSGTYRNNFSPTIPDEKTAEKIIKKIQKYSDVEITYTPVP